MALAVFGYSVFPIFARGIYQGEALRPSDIAAWRFLLATPTLWLILFLGQRFSVKSIDPKGSRLPPRWQLLGLGVLHGAASLPAFLALEQIAAGLYSILFYSYPTMVAVLALALGEKLSRIFWLALGGTTLGVTLALVPGLSAGGPATQNLILGGALALLNAFLVASYFQLSRHILRETEAVLRAVAWTFLGSLSLLLLLALWLGLRLPSGQDFALLLGLALCSTVLALVARNLGIQRLGPPRAALVATVEPLVTLGLAALFLAEHLAVVQWLGGALILASVISLARAARHPSPAKQASQHSD